MKTVNIFYGYINTHTIDANNHPEVQREMLLNLIKRSKNSEINIYCNSPYVLFYITILEAYSRSNIPEEHKGIYAGIKIINKHFEILKDGRIIEGKYYKSMISDENLLNDYLEKSNIEFSEFLDLCDSFKGEDNL